MADVRALIRELGQVRNALDADIIQIGGVDTGAAGLLSLGTTNATSITIGQGGVTTTFPGDVDIDGTLTIVDGGSLIGDGDVTLGGGDGDTITLGGTFATANDIVNIGTTAVGGDTVVNLRTNMGVGVGKRINFDRTADSESALLLPDTKDAPVGLAAGMVRVNGGGLLEWYNGAAWLTVAATATYTLDEAYNASGGASTITVDAGDVSWNLTGAFSIVTNLAGCTGAADGFFIEDGTDYLRLTHAAANTLNLTADFGSVNIGTSLTFDVVSLGIATISSPAGVGIISDANDAGANAITIRSTNVGAGTATLNIDAKNQIYVDAGGDILIGGAANTGAISLGNSASARTVTVGSTNTTSSLALQAGTGLISFTDGYKAASTWATDLVLSDASAEWDTFELNFGEVSLLNALNQCATSVVTLDDAYNASSGASTITVDAGDVTWNQTGAYSFVVDTSAATGTGDGFHIEEGTDYFRLNHGAANALVLSSELVSVGFNTSDGVTIRANHSSEFRVTGDNLTLTTITSGTLAVSSAAALDLDGVAVTLDASGGFSVDGSGAACNVSATSQDLTLSTITAGTLAVSSAALLTLSDGYKAGSTYATDLVLSDSIVEWSAFDTAFGEVSLLNAISGLKDGNAATVTVADTASATCWVGLYEAASGSLAGKTDAALTYNATTGALAATSMGVATGGAFTYNAISAVSAITAKNDWNFGGGGNLSMTAEQVVCIGPSAGAAVTNTGYSVYLGYSAASSVVGAYGNNAIIGCIAVRDATSIKNSVVSGYAAGIGMNGDYDIAIGASAGRYYGAGTDQNVSATQCVYLGGLSRAYASGNTNEIVIGYNAIGAGSNTATLGNTSITSTVLRGDVTGPTSYTATTAGVAKSVTDVLTINNSAHAADMDGTGSAILFNLTEDTGATSVDAGRIAVIAEQDLTSTASSQDTAMVFYTSLNGTNAERVRINSAGSIYVNNGTYLYGKSVGGTQTRLIGVNGSDVAYIGSIDVALAELNILGGPSEYILNYVLATDLLTLKTANTNRLRIDAVGNTGLNGLVAFGTNAAGVLGLASGTAPTTSPADSTQLWGADRGGTAGKAGLHIRSEDGTSHVFSDNCGIGTVSPGEKLDVAGTVRAYGGAYAINQNITCFSARVGGVWTSRIKGRSDSGGNPYMSFEVASDAADASTEVFRIGGYAASKYGLSIGGVVGTSLLDVEATGTAKAITNFLELTNNYNNADMDGTGTAILWNQWYYDAATPAVADAGRIACVTETDWTSTASTQKSYLRFETCFEGTVAERWRIASSGALSNTAAIGTAYLHLAAGTATASTAPLKFTDGVLLATAEEGAEELDVGTRWMTPISTQREAVVGCGCAQYEAFHVTHSE